MDAIGFADHINGRIDQTPVYLTIDVIFQPNLCLPDDVYADFRFWTWTPSPKFTDSLKSTIHDFPSSWNVIMSAMVAQITVVLIVYPAVCSGADQRKNQNSASLAFVQGIRRWLVDSPHEGPVTRKMLPFDDVIMILECPIEIDEPSNWYTAMFTLS